MKVSPKDLHGPYPRRGVNLGKYGSPEERRNPADKRARKSRKRA